MNEGAMKEPTAAEKNEENVVVSSDPSLVKAFRSEFDSLWAQFA